MRPMFDRRTFLKSAALTTAGLTFGSPLMNGLAYGAPRPPLPVTTLM